MTDSDGAAGAPRVAGELDAVDREERLQEPVALRARRARRRRPLGDGELEGRGHADGAGDVLRPGPAVPLLRAAVLLGEEVRAAADPQRADALRPLDLVGGQRDEVGAERRTSSSTHGAAWTASTWKQDARGAPGRRAAISAIGWSVPTSLLASITDTSVVRSLIAASISSGSTRP